MSFLFIVLSVGKVRYIYERYIIYLMYRGIKSKRAGSLIKQRFRHD